MLRFFYVLALILSINSSFSMDRSGKLLLTGGVSSLEGAAGGGITPWAFIGSYATKDQIGANAFYTNVNSSDYRLEVIGGLISFYDRAELSIAKQTFDTENVGIALGLGRSFKLRQDVIGLKLKIIGDGVLEQDSWLPQISIGSFYKKNQNENIVRLLGAKSESGFDHYVAASKIFLKESLLFNATLRNSKANQMGLLGFGGDKNNHHKLYLEGSVAYLLFRELALGVEYRSKPDNLGVAKEEDFYDFFVAWAPTKNISLTVAYALLGNIALEDNQHGLYSSLQIGF